jgi:hypothetical protein
MCYPSFSLFFSQKSINFFYTYISEKICLKTGHASLDTCSPRRTPANRPSVPRRPSSRAGKCPKRGLWPTPSQITYFKGKGKTGHVVLHNSIRVLHWHPQTDPASHAVPARVQANAQSAVSGQRPVKSPISKENTCKLTQRPTPSQLARRQMPKARSLANAQSNHLFQRKTPANRPSVPRRPSSRAGKCPKRGLWPTPSSIRV